MYLSQNPKLLHVSLCHWIYTLKESSLSLEVPQRAQLTTATAKIFIDKIAWCLPHLMSYDL